MTTCDISCYPQNNLQYRVWGLISLILNLHCIQSGGPQPLKTYTVSRVWGPYLLKLTLYPECGAPRLACRKESTCTCWAGQAWPVKIMWFSYPTISRTRWRTYWTLYSRRRIKVKQKKQTKKKEWNKKKKKNMKRRHFSQILTSILLKIFILPLSSPPSWTLWS